MCAPTYALSVTKLQKTFQKVFEIKAFLFLFPAFLYIPLAVYAKKMLSLLHEKVTSTITDSYVNHLMRKKNKDHEGR